MTEKITKQIIHGIKFLLGADPKLMEIDERTKRLKARMDGEDDWLFICEPIKGSMPDRIKCSDNETYEKVQRDD